MSDKANKAKPIAERIAALMGKSAFRDIREGFGGSAPALTDQDVAAALGAVQRQHGELMVQALETFYGSTLMHEVALRRAWDRRTDGRAYAEVVLSRMGCALAVRQFAGADYPQAQISDYAWLIRVRREDLQAAISYAEDWLDAMMMEGRRALVEQLRGAPIPEAA